MSNAARNASIRQRGRRRAGGSAKFCCGQKCRKTLPIKQLYHDRKEVTAYLAHMD